MATIVIEHFDQPSTARDARTLGDARRRAAEQLAGRTVWCAMALPAGRRRALELRARVAGAGPGVAAAPLEVTADEPLRRLAERLDGMLTGTAPGGLELGAAEQDLYAEGTGRGDVLGGDAIGADAIGADDVVVVHDALSAILARAVREQGAHTIWRIRVAERPAPGAQEAFAFLQRFSPGVDAYIMAWIDRGPRRAVVERIAAAMPSAGVVAAKEFPARGAGDDPERLAWRTALAEVVRSDRGESVGGTLHPRPVVAAR
jgi:hypothetical protein